MKLLLIAPNHQKILSPRHMQAVQQSLGCLPPLGLLSIAGYVREKTAHRVSVLDALLLRLSPAQVEKAVRDEEPDVVGVHAITLALPDVIETCRAVRRARPRAKVIVGGPHATLFPAETLDFPEVDYVVAGEGEEPAARLLDYLEEPGTKPFPAQGVMGRESGGEVLPFLHPRLDELPFAARDLTPYGQYQTVVSGRPPSTTMMGSRGCPYACTFCHTAGGKEFRPRSPESMMGEISRCVEMGIREFFFFDETFTLDRKRVMDFCRLVRESGLEIFWDVRGRVDLVDGEMLRGMRDAGCQRIQYGVESGSEKVLKRLKKGFGPRAAIEGLRMTREAGIATYADFMIGNPGETMEDVEMTLRLAREISPDYVHYSITIPYPRTALYWEALETGIIKEDYWLEFAKNPAPGFRVRYWEENFTAAQLESLVKRAYRDFYLRPGYVARSIARLRSPGEFLRKARAGLGILLGL